MCGKECVEPRRGEIQQLVTPNKEKQLLAVLDRPPKIRDHIQGGDIRQETLKVLESATYHTSSSMLALKSNYRWKKFEKIQAQLLLSCYL